MIQLRFLRLVLLLAATLLAIRGHVAADETDELLKNSEALLSDGRADEALKLLDQACKLDANNARAYHMRGNARDLLGKFSDAVADFTKSLELNSKNSTAYHLRGQSYFKLGEFARSVEDFDKFLDLVPSKRPGHWQRGISCYYAGQFDEGRKQFEGYEKVDTNDVENAVWRFLCMAKKDGIKKAQDDMMKIGHDTRVPLMEAYELYSGRAKVDDVLKAVRQGSPSESELKSRFFYANLYLGLYYDVQADKAKAIEHLAKAVKGPKISPYMWEVARIHLAELEKDKKKPNSR